MQTQFLQGHSMILFNHKPQHECREMLLEASRIFWMSMDLSLGFGINLCYFFYIFAKGNWLIG